MQLIIDKKAFENLSDGTHSLRVDFKDGFTVGKFHKGNGITFTIMGVVCTATEDMTWRDWFISYGSVSGNNYIMRDNGDGYLYINHLSKDVYGDVFKSFSTTTPSYNIPELALFAQDGATSPEKETNKIRNGCAYGLDPTGPMSA